MTTLRMLTLHSPPIFLLHEELIITGAGCIRRTFASTGESIDVNPVTRITISKIRESTWFRRGLHMKQRKMEKRVKETEATIAGPKLGKPYRPAYKHKRV